MKLKWIRKPYHQGGYSWRLAIPKEIIEAFKLPEKMEIVLDTEAGTVEIKPVIEA
jgi:hypothetical protein